MRSAARCPAPTTSPPRTPAPGPEIDACGRRGGSCPRRARPRPACCRCAASSRERVEQHRVVARMQADGRLVEHVAHALQVRAELRGEPDALRLAARERRRGAVERQIAQARPARGTQARADLGEQHRARSRARAPSRRRRRRTRALAVDRSARRAAAMERSRKRTCSAIGLSRCALAGSRRPSASRPNHSLPPRAPRRSARASNCSRISHARCRSSRSHQPCLELKENRRGSSSAKLVPQAGQARLVENTVTRAGAPAGAQRRARSALAESSALRRARARSAASFVGADIELGHRQLDGVLERSASGAASGAVGTQLAVDAQLP